MKLSQADPPRAQRARLKFMPLFDGPMRPEAIDNVLRNGLTVELLDGIVSADLSLYRVELREGRTRDELEAYFRTLKPCSTFEAFEHAADRGLVSLTNSGERVEVVR